MWEVVDINATKTFAYSYGINKFSEEFRHESSHIVMQAFLKICTPCKGAQWSCCYSWGKWRKVCQRILHLNWPFAGDQDIGLSQEGGGRKSSQAEELFPKARSFDILPRNDRWVNGAGSECVKGMTSLLLSHRTILGGGWSLSSLIQR